MKYKVGDRVKIKSLDWHNENKNQLGRVNCGSSYTIEMSFFCGKILTIQAIGLDFYLMEEDNLGYEFTDEMIEGLVEEENKVGTALNPIELKSNANCLTREMIEEFTEEENEKKLSDESWRYKNIFDSSQYPQSFELPEGYIFKDENGNVINATKIVLEKKKKEYPKTYEECLKVLGYDDRETYCIFHTGADERLFESLYRLKVCRNAYWKLYGEEMGLGKPWSPTDSDYITGRYCIFVHRGNIICDTPAQDCPLTFPTEEMRDAFYENFKEEIEQCKELL